MIRCEIVIHYAQNDGKNSLTEQRVILHPSGDLPAPKIWRGTAAYGRYEIIVTQKNSRKEVSSEDVQILPTDQSEANYFVATSLSEVANDFNNFLRRLAE